MIAILTIIVSSTVGAPAIQSAERVRFESRSVGMNSGRHDGAAQGIREAFSAEVGFPGAAVIRVAFDQVSLGEGSFISIRSLRDGDEQRLDARSLPVWGMASGYLNGDRVRVTLHVAPADRGASIRIAGVMGGMSLELESICGNDDRVSSTDNRVGRVNFNCTAWRIGNGALLTAGHCADSDPDDAGPMLPDGTLDWNMTVVEFNVPNSDPNGAIVVAPLVDQYPVLPNSVQWRFDGQGQGFGKDWAVFRVGANADTGLLPHQAYGIPFRISRDTPAVGATVRVTGFGTDGGIANQTNQTSTGTFQGESADGPDISLSHRVDTQGGNSGSPIVWESNGVGIGIHTNAGCTVGGGENVGTSFEVNALETAINTFPSNNTIYVDNGHPLVPAFEGTLMRPLASIAAGVIQVPDGGRMSIFSGIYVVSPGTLITKQMSLEAPVGTVTIVGQ